MRIQAAVALILIAIAAGTLASCGGGSGNSAALLGVEPAQAFPADEARLPALPPGEEFNPSKITAAVTTMRDGVAAFDHSAGNVALIGPHADFTPAAGELAWSMYEFPGSVYDDLGDVEYFASSRGADDGVWMAISNYAVDSWEFLGSRAQDHGTFSPPGGQGDYASPAGHTYLMVLGWDDVAFHLDKVQITYTNRYAVTGQVVDLNGVGVPMATVTSSLGGPGVMTDAAGNFTMPAIPEGTWQFMATKPGWVFYDIPMEVTVSGGPTTGVEFVGRMNDSHFEPIEDEEPNDSWWEAPNEDPLVPIADYISVSDDPSDYYRFALTSTGQYWVRVAADPDVLFPHISLFTKEGQQFAESSWVGSGVVYVPIPVATTRVVIAEVWCSGGGGGYTLDIGAGNLHKLTGHIQHNITTDNLDYVAVQCDNGIEVTNLYTASGSGNFLNNYMPAIVTTVTPDPDDIDPYTYTPLTFNANLAVGDVTNADFDGSGTFIVDPFEPNDTKGTAYHFAAMPVEGEVCNIAGATTYDWYSVSPAAGKDLIVRIEFDKADDYWGSEPMYLSLENDPATEYSYSYTTDTGLEVRTVSPCDGGDYYIEVASSFTNERTHFYTLWVEEVDAYKLEVGALWKTDSSSFGLENARIDIRSPEYNWTQSFLTAHSGLTEIPFRFKDGEKLYAEIFRYGTTLDRYTRHFTIDGDDIKYWFICYEDECEDSWESNDEYGKYVDYPADFDATISSDSDPIDVYLITPVSANMLHVGITTPDNGLDGLVELYDNTTPFPTWLASHDINGGGDFYFETAGMIEHRVVVSCYGGDESAYHITIDEEPGYKLSGTLEDAGHAIVPYSYIYCPALDYQFAVYPWSVDGSYEIGPFPSGSYQIYVYGANYDPTPASPWTLNVAGSDVVQDFELNANPTDVGEPNGTWGTASGPLLSGVPVVANINSDSDVYDFWSFTVGGPGMLNSYITFEKGFGSPSLHLYDTDGTTVLGQSTLSETNYQRIDYSLPAAGTYFLRVSGFGANDYTIAVNY